MKRIPSSLRRTGFTVIELLVVIAVIGLLVALLLPALAKAKSRAQRISCNSRLKQISLGFKQWALDNTNRFPMTLSTNIGGTKELISRGETFRHFEVMSNELVTAAVLSCPSDNERNSVRNFSPALSNTNVSYFVGLEAEDAQPQMFLAGDRNIISGVRSSDRVVGLTTNNMIGWGPGLHQGQGNVALADGSVQGFSTNRLREAIANTGVATNWLQLP